MKTEFACAREEPGVDAALHFAVIDFPHIVFQQLSVDILAIAILEGGVQVIRDAVRVCDGTGKISPISVSMFAHPGWEDGLLRAVCWRPRDYI
jgi:hypothetical protein